MSTAPSKGQSNIFEEKRLDMFWAILLYSLLVTSLATAAPSSSAATCTTTDIEGSQLDSASVTADGMVVCAWQIACDCVYNSPSGTLASGSTSCPKNIIPAASSGAKSGSSAKTSGAIGEARLQDADTTTPSSSSNSSSYRPSPAVIAGIAINGVLALGLLVLVAICVFRRPQAQKRAGMKVLYTSVESDNDITGRETFVPLTQGAYYDPHEDKDGPVGGFCGCKCEACTRRG
ncbi:hypothetical protein MKEN_01424800 [Mycena kentingensis (nom. inval.)]|nr:hypothetical protein MKEN_01424800 [Mycena kentingensis (nom. inval.)]